jgi:hypothetical protein
VKGLLTFTSNLAGFWPLNENLQVNDVLLHLTTVPYAKPPVVHELIHTVVSLLKLLPVIVTVTSPLLGPLSGETLEIVTTAAAGIPTTNSRSRRTRQTRRGNRFMTVLLYTSLG